MVLKTMRMRPVPSPSAAVEIQSEVLCLPNRELRDDRANARVTEVPCDDERLGVAGQGALPKRSVGRLTAPHELDFRRSRETRYGRVEHSVDIQETIAGIGLKSLGATLVAPAAAAIENSKVFTIIVLTLPHHPVRQPQH